MEIDGREAVRCCLSRDCLHASAIGLPTSCSPERQLPKSVGLRAHPSTFPHFLSSVLLFLNPPPKKQLTIIFLWLCFCILLYLMLTCYSVNYTLVPHNEKTVQSQTQVTYLSIQQQSSSRAGGFTHSLHHGAVNSFSYPVKGRVNPPSIWHTAHLAERHSGWLEGGESRGSCCDVERGGGGGGGGCILWEVLSWADGPLSGVVSGVFTWQRRLQDLTGPGLSIQVATAPPDQLEERWDHLTLAGKWYTFLCCFVLSWHKSPEPIKEFS